MTGLPKLMVAPNGARRSKKDHPALPTTLPEIVTAALDCQRAGADGLHLHLRDRDGRHVLDSGLYREALDVFAEQVPSLRIQITSESGGRYGPEQQRRVILESGAEMVSAAIRELLANGEIAETGQLFRICADMGVAIQHILYAPDDLDRLHQTLEADQFRDPSLQLLFVLGRYSADEQSDPAMLQPFLDAMARFRITPDWAVCAFGRAETACLVAASRHGGKIRVGFENSFFNADGTVARDNAERVRDVVSALGA